MPYSPPWPAGLNVPGAHLGQGLEHKLEAVAGDVLPLRTGFERCLHTRAETAFI